MNVYKITVNNTWTKRVEASTIGVAINRALRREGDNKRDYITISVRILAKNMTLKQYKELKGEHNKKASH